MPIYKGNRGNLLQHWVLAELVTLLREQVGPNAQLCFVDAHAMSPYATRSPKPDSTASDFDSVRDRLPGQGTVYEQAWEKLAVEQVEYPTSAMFVRHLWHGPLSMVLCETDGPTADDIFEWQRTLRHEPSEIELHRGDWRRRLREELPRAEAHLVSFDPYMIMGENPASSLQGHMYLWDLIRAAASILEIQTGPLLVQLSTYSAQNSPQDKIIAIVTWVMAAVGVELVETVHADGHMMSMILARNVSQPLKHMNEHFNTWLSSATKHA